MTAAGKSRGEMPDKASARMPDAAGDLAPDTLPDMGPDLAAAHEALGESDGHHHRDVSGGWLRPAVFGAMDGLVTNVSLIAGVGGGIASVGGAASRTLILTGLAGLAAGAFSMATGEYVSVSSQNELIEAEVSKERFELENHPDAERHELAAVFRQRGVDADLADRVARQVSAHPEQALREHVREELGVDHHDLPSPVTAAAASLVTFAAGALVPLLPYLAGFDSLPAALILAAIAAFVGGGVVSRITSRPFLRGAGRQLALAAVAAGLTYGIGVLFRSLVH
ncbi:MAG: VIT1/CCC1 transporter family protein [Streptosporangiaceae bacterium]|jgi:VIT1/CCC1 family predicted Fe2+/Mn2+ transporter